jgi:hypothetical protein
LPWDHHCETSRPGPVRVIEKGWPGARAGVGPGAPGGAARAVDLLIPNGWVKGDAIGDRGGVEKFLMNRRRVWQSTMRLEAVDQLIPNGIPLGG